jgi:hypothetical protein
MSNYRDSFRENLISQDTAVKQSAKIEAEIKALMEAGLSSSQSLLLIIVMAASIIVPIILIAGTIYNNTQLANFSRSYAHFGTAAEQLGFNVRLIFYSISNMLFGVLAFITALRIYRRGSYIRRIDAVAAANALVLYQIVSMVCAIIPIIYFYYHAHLPDDTSSWNMSYNGYEGLMYLFSQIWRVIQIAMDYFPRFGIDIIYLIAVLALRNYVIKSEKTLQDRINEIKALLAASNAPSSSIETNQVQGE